MSHPSSSLAPASDERNAWRTRRLSELRARFDVVEEAIELPGWTAQLYRPASAEALIDEADFNRDGRIPYWAEVWASAPELAAELLAHPGQGRRLLELGCGVGLVVAAALRAGYDVLGSDYYPEALEFVELNAAVNDLPRPATRMIDWRRLPDDLGTFDLVVAADVLYEAEYDRLIAATLARAMRDDGEAWVCDPERTRAAGFPAACEAVGLQARVERRRARQGEREQAVTLFRVRRA